MLPSGASVTFDSKFSGTGNSRMTCQSGDRIVMMPDAVFRIQIFPSDRTVNVL